MPLQVEADMSHHRIFYRNKSASGTISGGIGAAMTELDRIVNPATEYRIQAEDPIVEEDEKGGD